MVLKPPIKMQNWMIKLLCNTETWTSLQIMSPWEYWRWPLDYTVSHGFTGDLPPIMMVVTFQQFLLSLCHLRKQRLGEASRLAICQGFGKSQSRIRPNSFLHYWMVKTVTDHVLLSWLLPHSTVLLSAPSSPSPFSPSLSLSAPFHPPNVSGTVQRSPRLLQRLPLKRPCCVFVQWLTCWRSTLRVDIWLYVLSCVGHLLGL